MRAPLTITNNAGDLGEGAFARIFGKRQLGGEVIIPGDKVSAMHCLLAAIICNEPTEIHNIPLCGDVLDILNWASNSKQAVIELPSFDMVKVRPVSDRTIDLRQLRHLRSPICTVTAVGLQTGEVQFARPGGCQFTGRPVERHLALLESFGFEVRETGDSFTAKRHRSVPSVAFSCAASFGPSVGVTCNALMAALHFQGDISLTDCAREPVIDCVIQLIASHTGRAIRRRGRRIHVLSKPHPQSDKSKPHLIRLPADATVVTTYLAVLAACGGRLKVFGITSPLPFLDDIVRRWGIGSHVSTTCISYQTEGGSHLGNLRCSPWPGLPSDVGPMIIASVGAVPGTTRLIDAVYPSRSSHVPGLRTMGYRVQSNGPETTIVGQVPHGEFVKVAAPDIRAGAALVVGALARRGCTEIASLRQIFRGYTDLFGNLRQLGLDVSVYES